MSKKAGWTTTPNAIYDAMPDMSEVELRVTMALVRRLYGFHKSQCDLTYKDLHEATGLVSPSSIREGVKAVLDRGFFERTGRSTWHIAGTVPTPQGGGDDTDTVMTTGNVEDNTTDIVEDDYISRSEYYTESVVSTSSAKEKDKENYKENTPLTPQPAVNGNGNGAVAVSPYRQVVLSYEGEIGQLTRHIGALIEVALEEFEPETIVEAIHLASENGVRRWSYVEGILKRWRTEGRGKLRLPPTKKVITILTDNGPREVEINA